MEKNEYISKLLSREGIPHHVLNAKNHEQEAAIIAQAGAKGAVTVATNMAGRGVDIILGGNPYQEQVAQDVRALGGLHVIGTERHEARRIDNQLRGRSGRQGDPGSSQFYVSLEDDLMRVFGSEKIQPYFERLGLPEDEAVSHAFVTRALDSAQNKVEGLYFDMRKHVLEYDDVLNKQRDAFYRERTQVLVSDDDAMRGVIDAKLSSEAWRIAQDAFMQENPQVYCEQMFGSFAKVPESLVKTFAQGDAQVIASEAGAWLSSMVSKAAETNPKEFWAWARMSVLRVFDMYWMNHLDAMEGLRDSASLRSYGQHDPLVEYRREGHHMYKDLFAQMDMYIALFVARQASEVQSHARRSA